MEIKSEHDAEKRGADWVPRMVGHYSVCLIGVCLVCGCNLLQPDGEKHLVNKPKWWDRNVYENLEPTPGSTNWRLEQEAKRTNSVLRTPRDSSE